jgi:hypothetical protein
MEGRHPGHPGGAGCADDVGSLLARVVNCKRLQDAALSDVAPGWKGDTRLPEQAFVLCTVDVCLLGTSTCGTCSQRGTTTQGPYVCVRVCEGCCDIGCLMQRTHSHACSCALGHAAA